MNTKDFQKPWTRPTVALASLLALGLSLAARADTYNFHFPSKGKPDADESTATQAAAAPTAPATPTVQSLSATLPTGSGAGTPIVINNTNNVGYAPAPVAAAPVPAPVASQSVAVTAGEASPSSDALRWHFGVTTIFSNTPRKWGGRDNPVGGQVTLGYRFTRGIGLNFYGGLREISSSQWHLGADLEALPFRIHYQGVDALELGFLVGLSNALGYSAYGDPKIAPHAGLRANVNFGDRFGITASGRANPDYWMLEAGLITRL